MCDCLDSPVLYWNAWECPCGIARASTTPGAMPHGAQRDAHQMRSIPYSVAGISNRPLATLSGETHECEFALRQVWIKLSFLVNRRIK